ncbi:MAG: hypothetical protein EOM66_02140 [Clostridia bacterium]|nr:hypothetical protein [Candidatus Pelethousia sp.]NCB30189.1 hypothetical protein [Clostridia bacterium]
METHPIPKLLEQMSAYFARRSKTALPHDDYQNGNEDGFLRGYLTAVTEARAVLQTQANLPEMFTLYLEDMGPAAQEADAGNPDPTHQEKSVTGFHNGQ